MTSTTIPMADTTPIPTIFHGPILIPDVFELGTGTGWVVLDIDVGAGMTLELLGVAVSMCSSLLLWMLGEIVDTVTVADMLVWSSVDFLSSAVISFGDGIDVGSPSGELPPVSPRKPKGSTTFLLPVFVCSFSGPGPWYQVILAVVA